MTGPNERINVLLADESRMGCQMLSAAVKGSAYHISVVGTGVNSAEILKLVSESNPDVALVSASLEDGPTAGFQLVREMHTAHPETRAVLLLDRSEQEKVVHAFRAGAKGILCRADSIKALRKCIYSVYKGQIWASSRELQMVMGALTCSRPWMVGSQNSKSPLTSREREIVDLVAEGLTNREISRRLRLSNHTIKNHLFRIFDRLGVSTRVELVLLSLAKQDSGEFIGH